MARIECDVTNCSHNKSHICFANRINVAGGNALKNYQTCCASFLDQSHYSHLTSNTNDYGSDCNAIVCDVQSCHYNANKICNADSIHVTGNHAHLYEETNCGTFERE